MPKLKRSKPTGEVEFPVRHKIDLRKVVFLVAILALVVFLGFRNKGILIAGTVGNRPIWRWELENRMVSRYSSQTIDEISSEMIIADAASKKGIKVASQEIDTKIAEIEKQLAGQTTLVDALTAQQMTMSDLRKQIELQLMLEKLTAGQVAVTEQEITDYVDKNKDNLVSTDEAGMRAEAQKNLFSTKQNDTLRSYFTQLKSSARVSKFI